LNSVPNYVGIFCLNVAGNYILLPKQKLVLTIENAFLQQLAEQAALFTFSEALTLLLFIKHKRFKVITVEKFEDINFWILKVKNK